MKRDRRSCFVRLQIASKSSPERCQSDTPGTAILRPGSPRILLRPRITLTPAPQTAAPVELFAPGLLRTARLTLRPLRDSDRPEFLRVIGTGRQHLEPFSRLHREGETDDQLFERHLRLCHEGDQHNTAWRRVALLSDGRIAGAFNLTTITRGLSFEADANWWISADQTRQGL